MVNELRGDLSPDQLADAISEQAREFNKLVRAAVLRGLRVDVELIDIQEVERTHGPRISVDVFKPLGKGNENAGR